MSEFLFHATLPMQVQRRLMVLMVDALEQQPVAVFDQLSMATKDVANLRWGASFEPSGDIDREPWITVGVVYGQRTVDVFKVPVREVDPDNLMGLAA